MFGNIKTLSDFVKTFSKKKYFFILWCSIIAAILESLSIFNIYLVINLFASQESEISNGYIYIIINYLSKFNYFYLTLFFIAYLLSAQIFRIFLLNLITKYSLDMEYLIGSRLLDGLVNRLNDKSINNQSDFTKSILNESNQLTHQGILPLIHLYSSLFILAGLVLVLFTINKVVSIVCILFFIFFYIAYYLLTKNYIKSAGIKRLEINGLRFSLVKDIIDSIDEIKLYSLKESIIKKFILLGSQFSDLQRIPLIANQIPKYIIEFFLLSIFSLLAFMVYEGYFDMNTSLTLVPFIFAALKILPIIQIINSSLQSIRFSYPILEKINSLLLKFEISTKDKINNIYFKKQITVEGFYKLNETIIKYNKIIINKNKIIGIKGQSGSGKSTLIKCIMKILISDNLKVHCDSVLIDQSNIKAYRDFFGYLPQDYKSISGDISENIIFFRSIDLNRLRESLNFLNLKNDNFIIDKIEKRIESSKLSGGQIQRMVFARALYARPEILIIDEGLNAQDEINSKELFRLILKLKKSGMTIIIVSHQKNLLEQCDYLIDLDN